MRSVAKYLLACLLCLLMTATASACLWDYDTLQMERMRFPATLEIITGKFVRHTPAYYEWRIVDRQRKLAVTPDDPALLDDLAVAYGKLGRPEEGIALLEPTLARRPDRYETLSNLGTLLFFAGRLDESKDYIRRALEVNPNAHFGRERYQLLLTEYLQQSEHATSGVMSTAEVAPHGRSRSFAQYVFEKNFGDPSPPAGELSRDQDASSEQEKLQDAVRGVLGMMHFADHQSPILLEALGDLLKVTTGKGDSTQLAARAYLRAAQRSTGPAVAKKFRKMASESLSMHVEYHREAADGSVEALEAELAQEMAVADEWYAAIETKERQWIAEKRDVDAAFAAEYYDDSLASTVAAAEEQLENEPWQPRRFSPNEILEFLFIVGGLICVGVPVTLISVVLIVFFWRRRRRRIAATRLPPVPESPVT